MSKSEHIDQLLCPVCTSSNVRLLQTDPSAKYIDKYKEILKIDVSNYFNDIEQVTILNCHTCSYNFYHPFELQGRPELYEELSKNDSYYLEEKWEFKAALASLNKGMKVLEIGCGKGNFLELAHNIGVNIEGLDSGKNIQTKSISGVIIHNQVIESFARTHKNSFDAILAFQVLEHLTEIQTFMKACFECLKPNGKLILAVPNNDAKILKYDSNNCLNMPPHHMGLYNPMALSNIPNHYPYTLLSLEEEPLSEVHSKKYYRIYITHLRKKMGLFGRVLDKILYPISEPIINSLRSKLKGQSMLAIFQKIETS